MSLQFLAYHRVKIEGLATQQVSSLGGLEHKEIICLCGHMESICVLETKNCGLMANCIFRDLTGKVETYLFPDVYAKSHALIEKKAFFLKGTLDVCDVRDPKVLVIADDVLSFEEGLSGGIK